MKLHANVQAEKNLEVTGNLIVGQGTSESFKEIYNWLTMTTSWEESDPTWQTSGDQTQCNVWLNIKHHYTIKEPEFAYIAVTFTGPNINFTVSGTLDTCTTPKREDNGQYIITLSGIPNNFCSNIMNLSMATGSPSFGRYGMLFKDVQIPYADRSKYTITLTEFRTGILTPAFPPAQISQNGNAHIPGNLSVKGVDLLAKIEALEARIAALEAK